jgi:hypothetical protein
LFAVLFLAGSLLAAGAPVGGSGDADTTIVASKEWTGERAGWTLFNDTDGDGKPEMILWSEHDDHDGAVKGTGHLRVYDLPGYVLRYSLDGPGWLDLQVRDLQGDGISELLVTDLGIGSVNLTIVSGLTFKELWKSPDFSDGNMHYKLSDLDADGELEIVWLGMYDNGSKGTDHTAVRMHAYGASTFHEKMNLSGFDGWSDEFWLADLDKDPAKEIVFRTHEMRGNTLAATRLHVVDGATGSVQWETPPDPSLTSISRLQFVDVDNDSAMEIVAAFTETDPVNGTVASIRVFSGNNGTLEWSADVGGHLLELEMAETDGDVGTEVLVTTDTAENSYENAGVPGLVVLDPGGGDAPWSVGPASRPARKLLNLDGRDLDGDGICEIIVTEHSYGKVPRDAATRYSVLDGIDHSTLWTSTEGCGKYTEFVPADLDGDGVFEFTVPETAAGADGKVRSRVHFISSGNYTEEWASGWFAGEMWVYFMQLDGGRRPVLSIHTFEDTPGTYDDTEQVFLLDGGTKEVLWSSPRRNGVEIYSANLVGGPENELLCVCNNWCKIPQTTEMYLYDGSGFGTLWSSGKVPDSLTVRDIGDLDGDGRGEVLTVIERDKGDQIADMQLVMWEFSGNTGPAPSPSGAGQADQEWLGALASGARWGGAPAVLVIAVVAAVASASAGALAFLLVKRRRAGAARASGGGEIALASPKLKPGADIELRK